MCSSSHCSSIPHTDWLVPHAAQGEGLAVNDLIGVYWILLARSLTATRNIYSSSPLPLAQVLQKLLELLQSVCGQEAVSRMSAHSLSLVFSPNLIWESRHAPLASCSLRKFSSIVEYMIDNGCSVFEVEWCVCARVCVWCVCVCVCAVVRLC